MFFSDYGIFHVFRYSDRIKPSKGGGFTNQARLIGTVAAEFAYSHEVFKEKFYITYIQIKRTSGTFDVIPAVFSERLINTKDNYTGRCIAVKGEFRSCNKDGKVLLYIFVQEYDLIEDREHYNDVFLEGYLCKKPTYRKTPLGREVTDALLAVNRTCGKADYIPCICWGKNALYVANANVGSNVRFAGRIQSREYEKNGEIRTAYEMSVALMEIVK